jgi:hypothetical protein
MCTKCSEWPRTEGPRNYGSIPDRCRKVFFPHSAQSVSGAHPGSYPMGIGGSFLSSKAAGAWNWPLTSI